MGLDLVPSLGINIILPIFQEEGKIPVSIDKLNLKHWCIGIALKASFRSLEVSLLTADDLTTDICLIALTTSSTVIRENLRSAKNLLNVDLKGTSGISFANFEPDVAKKLFI